MGELDEQRADAARGGQHEDALARLQCRRVGEERRRAAVGEQRDGVVEREVIGDVEPLARDGALRVATAAVQRGDHATTVH